MGLPIGTVLSQILSSMSTIKGMPIYLSDIPFFLKSFLNFLFYIGGNCQCWRKGSILGQEIPTEGNGNPTCLYLPGKSYGQEEPGGL